MEENLIPFNNQSFKCLQCGKCCQQRFVPLSRNDIDRISDNLDREDFIVFFPQFDKYTIERRKWDNSCYFLDDEKCRIYDIRPLVCRLYPLALYNEPINEEKTRTIKLDNNEKKFLYIDDSCPGVGKGEKFDMDKIKKLSTKISKEMDLTQPPNGIELNFKK